MANVVEKLELANVIGQLREQIQEAVLAGQGKALKFSLEEISIELQVAVTKEVSAESKLSFWVIDGKAGGKLASTQTHKVALKLKPQNAVEPGKPTLMSDESAEGYPVEP